MLNFFQVQKQVFFLRSFELKPLKGLLVNFFDGALVETLSDTYNILSFALFHGLGDNR